MTSFFKDKKHRYFKAFIIAFVLFYVIMLPVLVYNKGIFLYYGDFNSQQIPFYQLAHNAVREGNFFWDWNTDLGANFIGSYSFYLLGSPFFWLTVPFPNGAEVYMMPFLLALKFGVASLTAFAFIKRFVKRDEAALIGALLYAFSGFQAYNVFFNHFNDVTAFFPLLLITIEESVQKDRRGVFALTVALMAIISYFFFTGEVVFCIIYFICRCFCEDFKVTPRRFLALAIEAVLGVMLAAFLLLPSVLAIVDNPRTTERLLGLDMIAYSDRFRILRILQSFFMMPDIPARANLFSDGGAEWSSIAGYLPLFGMAGVVAFMRSRGKHFATRIIAICAIIAAVPALNSAFSGFTSSYYARWFFMPILIMAMMTAVALDEIKVESEADNSPPETSQTPIDLRFGAVVSIVAVMVFAVIGALPSSVDVDGEKISRWFAIPKYPGFFWAQIFVSLACGVALYALIFFMKRDEKFFNRSVKMTVAACLVCTGTLVGIGIANGPYPKPFIAEAVWGAEKIDLPEADDEFYRIDISEDMDNYPMSWGIPSVRAFQSVVPASIMEFYPTVGVARDVASRAGTEKFGLRGLLSVKYYFDYRDKVPDEDGNVAPQFEMPGFRFRDVQNNFDVYENDYYVPMGFTYDNYILRKTYDERSKDDRDKLLLKGLVLDEFQSARYGGLLKELPTAELSRLSKDDYLSDCTARAAQSCSSFLTDTRGFTAKIALERDNLVFFSVPFDKGFTATIDGVPAAIERVNVGFMAVKSPAGEHTIRFNYYPVGLKIGGLISLCGMIFLVIYLILWKKWRGKNALIRKNNLQHRNL